MTALVERVEVVYRSPGTLDVSWVTVGGDVSVDVAYGTTPETIDHDHVATIDAGSCNTTLREVGPGPHFVSVSPHGLGPAVVAGERRLSFDGIQNFRDLGGYPSRHGGHTRWGLVFRSDALHKLTDDDLDAFHRIGLRVVYDLRSDRERESNPNPVDSIQFEVIGRPRADDAEDEAAARAQFVSSPDGEQLLRDLYLGMLEHSAALFGRLLAGLTEPHELPAVFHCHAGKDRTGVTAALLLLALGVDREAVLDDYELTRRYRTLAHQQDSLANMMEMGMAPEAAAGVLSAPRWAMAEALDELAHRYGGIEAYLCGPAGMSPDTLQRLRATLVA